MLLVDTNILAYLLIEGDRTAAVQKLHARDRAWRSESFVMVEFSNILTTYVRGRQLTKEQGVALLKTAESSVSELITVPHAQALEVAAQFDISAYDARFVALAKQLGTRLVTEDRKLRVAVPAWTMSLEEAAA